MYNTARKLLGEVEEILAKELNALKEPPKVLPYIKKKTRGQIKPLNKTKNVAPTGSMRYDTLQQKWRGNEEAVENFPAIPSLISKIPDKVVQATKGMTYDPLERKWVGNDAELIDEDWTIDYDHQKEDANVFKVGNEFALSDNLLALLHDSEKMFKARLGGWSKAHDTDKRNSRDFLTDIRQVTYTRHGGVDLAQISICYVVPFIKTLHKVSGQSVSEQKVTLNLDKFKDDDVDWDDVKITKGPKLVSPHKNVAQSLQEVKQTAKEEETWDELDFPSPDLLQKKLQNVPGLHTLQFKKQTLSSTTIEDWSDDLTIPTTTQGKLTLNQKNGNLNVASQDTLIISNTPSSGNELDDL